MLLYRITHKHKHTDTKKANFRYMLYAQKQNEIR